MPASDENGINSTHCLPCKVVSLEPTRVDLSSENGLSIEDIRKETEMQLGLPSIALTQLEPLRMTSSKIIPRLEPIIQIGESIVSTPGNITVISGASKSGKTAAIGAVLAGAIAEGEYDGFEKLIVAPNLHKRAVIHIETEQSEPRHFLNHLTIISRANWAATPDWFLSYNIRREEIEKYKPIVEKACNGASQQFGGVFMIVIDGIADFISDVNAADEANEIIHWCEVLAIQYNAPVLLIVHTNPNSDKERGHLGSQLQRKSESLLLVAREGDISTLEAKLLRNAGIGDTPIIQFTYDKAKGYHVSCGIVVPLNSNPKDLKRIQDVKRVAGVVFGGGKSLGYDDVCEQIMTVSKKGITGSKNMFKEMKAQGFIHQINPGKNSPWVLK